MSSAPRSPTPVDAVVLVAIVSGAMMAARYGGGVLVGDWLVALGAAVVWGLALGMPALAYVLERGRATPVVMLAGGALAGLVPLAGLGVSGVVGLFVRSGGWDRVAWALERGMPVPATGVVYWDRFLRLETQAALLGMACGLMFWLLMVRATRENRGVNILLALFTLATFTTLSTLLR